MTTIRYGLAALVAAGGLAAAQAQQPVDPVQPVAPAKPQVIRWNGGYMVLDGPGMIYRQTRPGSGTSVVSGWLDNSRDDCATANFSIRHQGVLNGKAIKLAQPPYPIKAQQKHLTGTVFVSVVIDENGNVTEAKAICGPMPEFEQVAVEAARASRFTPTKLNNQPVTVTGVIIYNFVAR